jgi:chemotaxis protein CheX
VKLIRKILILSVNTDWANDLKKIFNENSKVNAEIASTRPKAVGLLTDQEYAAVIVEDTFNLKNMDFFFRSLSTINSPPKFIYLAFSDFNLYKTVSLPEKIPDNTTLKAYSLPLPKDTLVNLIYADLFPYGHSSDSDFDREFIQVLIKATQRVIESLGCKGFKAQKPDLLTKMKIDPEVVIRGKIIIKTEFFSGSIFLSFPEDTYKKLYGSLTGIEIASISEENRDFAGELANMVYGQAKKELEENGIKLDMAIPILDYGRVLRSNNPVYVIPVDACMGRMYIKLAPKYY